MTILELISLSPESQDAASALAETERARELNPDGARERLAELLPALRERFVGRPIAPRVIPWQPVPPDCLTTRDIEQWILARGLNVTVELVRHEAVFRIVQWASARQS